MTNLACLNRPYITPPCRSQPRLPNLSIPLQASRTMPAEPYTAPPCLNLPYLTSPAMPHIAYPRHPNPACLTVPCRTEPVPNMPNKTRPCAILPALPCLAQQYSASHRLTMPAKPRHTEPSLAATSQNLPNLSLSRQNVYIHCASTWNMPHWPSRSGRHSPTPTP